MSLYKSLSKDETVVTGNPFKDTTSSFATLANSLGFVKGFEDGLFKPNNNLTRQEAAVIMFRQWQKTNPEYVGELATIDFSDAGKIASWAEQAVKFMAQLQIINGTGGGILDPTGLITREQAITMVMNNYEKSAELIDSQQDELLQVPTYDLKSSATPSGGSSKVYDATSSATKKSYYDDDYEDDDDDDDYDYDDHDGEDD